MYTHYMTERYKKKDYATKRKEYIKQNQATDRKAKHALGIKKEEPLPRCPARSAVKVRAFEAEGDMSHSASGHICHECRCSKVAGRGTTHVGVGFCYHHEQGRRAGRSKSMARNQMISIQQGYPDDPWRYKSNDAYLDKIRDDAEGAKETLSMKEELYLLKANLQKVVDSWTDGNAFTETYRGEPVPASDEVKSKTLTRLVDSVGKLAKIQLDITSNDYVHVEEVKIWLSEFIRIIENNTSEEQYGKMVEEIKEVPQPVAGKR